MRLPPSAGGRRLDVASSSEPRRTREPFEVAAPVVANYRPRRPQDSVLYRVVRTHLHDFLRHVRENYERPLPRYVVDEFHEYLCCGDPAHGFVRAGCPSCGHVLLVPFSCKRRGVYVLALDGVFRRRGDAVMFRRAAPPTPEELAAVVDDVRRRVTRWLRRQGLLDDGDASEGPSGPLHWTALEGCAAAAVRQGAFEHLDLDGRGTPAGTDETRFVVRMGGRWSVECDGFDLHAGVTVDAGDDESREKLCRYAARPAFALGRLVELADGRIAYRVRWSNSPSGPFRVMAPLELLARLAAIVPPPRYPLVRYHGVLAPASRWRPLVVPRPRVTARCCGAAVRAPPGAGACAGAEWVGGTVPALRVEGRGLVTGVLVSRPSPDGEGDPYSSVITVRHWNRLMDGALLARGPRVDWATLLRRTFRVDALACPVCAGRLRVLELVTDPTRAQALLAGLGLGEAVQPKPRRSARGGQAQPRAP